MKEKQGDKPKEPNEAVIDDKDSIAASSVKEVEVNEIEIVPEITEQKKNEIAVASNNFNDIDISKINSAGHMMSLASILVEGNMCSFKKPADAMIALMAGKELGLGFTASLAGIHPIEGRPSLGVHLKKAILLSNNVIFKRTRDMEMYYSFAVIKNTKPVEIGRGYLDEMDRFQKLAKDKEVVKPLLDTRTEYLFTRYFKTPKGVIKNTAKGMFGIADATQAGLITKSNWKNYTRDMLSSRAFSRGANEIADDLLNGMYSYSELADLNDSVTYYIDDNGHEQIVTDEMINKPKKD